MKSEMKISELPDIGKTKSTTWWMRSPGFVAANALLLKRTAIQGLK